MMHDASLLSSYTLSFSPSGMRMRHILLGLSFHYDLWTRQVSIAWAKQRLDQKLVWLFFGVNSIGFITLIQIAFLKK